MNRWILWTHSNIHQSITRLSASTYLIYTTIHHQHDARVWSKVHRLCNFSGSGNIFTCYYIIVSSFKRMNSYINVWYIYISASFWSFNYSLSHQWLFLSGSQNLLRLAWWYNNYKRDWDYLGRCIQIISSILQISCSNSCKAYHLCLSIITLISTNFLFRMKLLRRMFRSMCHGVDFVIREAKRDLLKCF